MPEMDDGNANEVSLLKYSFHRINFCKHTVMFNLKSMQQNFLVYFGKFFELSKYFLIMRSFLLPTFLCLKEFLKSCWTTITAIYKLADRWVKLLTKKILFVSFIKTLPGRLLKSFSDEAETFSTASFS